MAMNMNDPYALLQLADIAGRVQRGETRNLPAVPPGTLTGPETSGMLAGILAGQGSQAGQSAWESYQQTGQAVVQGGDVTAAAGLPAVAAIIPWLARLFPGLARAGSTVASRIPWGPIGYGTAGYGLAQLFGGGGGGPGQQVIPGTDIGLGKGWWQLGMGAAEPAPQLIVKEWPGIGGSRFYLLINGRVVVRKANGVWRLIRRPRMIHMKATNPRLGDVVKADRVIQRAVKVVRRRLPSARRRK